MTYSQAKLQYALRVFQKHRKAERYTSSSTTEQRHLRNDYNFRQICTARNVKHVTLFREQDSSSDDLDEYNPSLAKRKRRLLKAVTRPSKRVKRECPSNPAHCQQEYMANDPDSMSLLSSLPENDQRKTIGKPDKSASTQQYLEKLDEEAAKIDNEHGRRLRNQKFILDQDRFPLIKRCLACTRARSRCYKKRNDEKCCTRCSKNRIECVDADDVCVNDPPAQQPLPKADDGVVKETIEESPSLEAHIPSPLAPVGPPTPSQIIRSHVASLQLQSQATSPQGGNLIRKFNSGSSRDNAIVLDSSPSPEPSPEPSPQPDPEGRLVEIRTTWAHPIDFKHKPTGREPCHFCSDFRYGIYGYGEITVHVIKYPDSPDYVETGDGHRSYREPTRMCAKCSLNRLYISRCKVHSIIPFGTRSKELEVKYLSQLLANDWEPDQPSLNIGCLRTCSLCPRPAYWRCNADKCRDKVGRPILGLRGKGVGCGLVLCDDCAPQVKVDGILRGTSIEQCDMAKSMIGRRADVDFLFVGSLLHNAFR
jgi:hypothetical protein